MDAASVDTVVNMPVRSPSLVEAVALALAAVAFTASFTRGALAMKP
jgi:hypothetical protein